MQPKAMNNDLPYCVVVIISMCFDGLNTMAWKIAICPSVAASPPDFPSIVK